MSSLHLPPRPSHDSPWTRDQLESWRSFYVNSSLAPSSRLSYSSAVRSYHRFCQDHQFPPEPSVDSLSFYLAYRSHSVCPQTLSTYLSAICNQLELEYPFIRELRQHPLVKHTVLGVHRVHAAPSRRKLPLMLTDLQRMVQRYAVSTVFDDQLFLAQLLTGFHQLLRLAELCVPDNPALFDVRKPMKRFEVRISPASIRLLLPAHKSDQFFSGSQLYLFSDAAETCPYPALLRYLHLRDQQLPWSPYLWLRDDGSHPTRSWFVRRLREHFDPAVSGHSMRAGGATALSRAGVSDDPGSLEFGIVQGLY